MERTSWPRQIKASSSLLPEIWTQIAHFACTDGGKTASSLLQVSRSVSDSVAIHAYTTVTLVGYLSVQSFLTRVASLTPNRRARIHNLFICKPVVDIAHPGESSSSLRGSTTRVYSEPDLTTLLHQLLPLISQTLRSLALISFTSAPLSVASIIYPLSIIHFPALQCLTLRSADYRPLPHPLLLPVVSHLYAFCPDHSVKAIAGLTRKMPDLIRLTLSGINYTTRTRIALEEALHEKSRVYISAMDSHVDTVTIQAGDPAQLLHDDTESAQVFRTRLVAEVGGYRTIEFVDAEHLSFETADEWRALWLKHIMGL
jgi:hypothetical protein